MSIAMFNAEGRMIARRVLAIAAAATVLGVISTEPAWAPNCTGSKCTNRAAEPQVKSYASGKRQHKPLRKPPATGDMNQSIQLNLQQSQQSYTQTENALSNIMKENSKTQQNVIQNMK